MQTQFIAQFIECKRTELGIKAEALADGILKHNTLRKIENNEIYADKLLFDTILQRLGVGKDYFEHYITLEDFDLLQLRNDILNEIDSDNVSNAKIKLDEYASKDTIKMSVHKQYYEYALTLIYKKENGISKELLDLYENVIKITVPKFKSKSISELLLSNWELFFILEYADIMKELYLNESIDYYKEILEYLRKGNIEDNIKAIFYSFVALPIIESMLKQDELTKALELTNETIEVLRKPLVLTNFTTMLDKKLELLDKLNLDQDNEKIAEWLEVLQEFYREHNVNPNTDRLKYQVFNWYDCYIINDVIKNRRLMLGLTQAEFIGDICDSQTISRIENRKSTPQPKRASLLLLESNLSGQLYSSEVLTSEYDVFVLYKDTVNQIKKGFLEIASNNLKLLKSKLDLENIVNIQCVKHLELIIKMKSNTITLDEYYTKLNDILRITLNLELANTNHLTKRESNLISNIIDVSQKLDLVDESYMYIELLNKYYNNKDMSITSSYIFYKNVLLSFYGNISKFEESNNEILDVIEYCFEEQMYWYLNNIAYGISWNYMAEIENLRELTKKEQKKYMKLLRTSYILSDIKDDQYAKRFIKSKEFKL